MKKKEIEYCADCGFEIETSVFGKSAHRHKSGKVYCSWCYMTTMRRRNEKTNKRKS